MFHCGIPKHTAARIPESATARTQRSPQQHPDNAAAPRHLLVPLAVRGRSPKILPTVLPPAEGLPPAETPDSTETSASRKTPPADVNGGQRLHHQVWPPLRYEPQLETGIPSGHEVRLCVFPRRFLPGRRERTGYTLYAANGTTIPTYGWASRSLNMGLRREFTWRFVVAGVNLLIIGWTCCPSMDSSSTAGTTGCLTGSHHCPHQASSHHNQSPV